MAQTFEKPPPARSDGASARVDRAQATIDASGATSGAARARVDGTPGRVNSAPRHAVASLEGPRRPPLRARSPRVSVVMPALNEAANLPHVLARLPDVYELIVVDGASSDGTSEAARSLWPFAFVIQQPGRGKGDALRAGFAAATGDIIVMLDADGSTDPAEIPRFVQSLLGGADFAKGSRFLPGGRSGDLTRTRRVGVRALTGLVNLLFGTGYTDLCYGYNAFWRHCVDDLSIGSNGFEVETLLNIKAARARLAVDEVPSIEHARLNGHGHLRPIRDGIRVLRTILRERVRRRPPLASDSPVAVNQRSAVATRP